MSNDVLVDADCSEPSYPAKVDRHLWPTFFHRGAPYPKPVVWGKGLVSMNWIHWVYQPHFCESKLFCYMQAFSLYNFKCRYFCHWVFLIIVYFTKLRILNMARTIMSLHISVLFKFFSPNNFYCFHWLFIMNVVWEVIELWCELKSFSTVMWIVSWMFLRLRGYNVGM